MLMILVINYIDRSAIAYHLQHSSRPNHNFLDIAAINFRDLRCVSRIII